MMKHSTVVPVAVYFCCIGVLIPIAGCGQADRMSSVEAAEQVVQPTIEQTANRPSEKEQVEIAAIIQANSKVLDEIGKIGVLMEESTDIIMRFNHFTDGHTKPVKLCPECWPAPDPDDSAGIEDPEEKIPETMPQLLKDSNELHLSMQRLRGHLSSQQFALKRHLKKLRAGKLDAAARQ